jgi:hypothetical protein
MKFTVQSTELKSVLQLVKVVSDAAAKEKVHAHSVCCMTADPEANLMTLEFALNGSFMSYRFREALLTGSGPAIRRSVDMSVLMGFKFQGPTVEITFDSTDGGGNKIEFRSGRLRGTATVAASHIEREIDQERATLDRCNLDSTFKIKTLLDGLACHDYGAHSRVSEPARRPVNIRLQGDHLVFSSQDRISVGHVKKPVTTEVAQGFNLHVLAKPLIATLGAIKAGDKTREEVRFGATKACWRLQVDTLDLWFPNMLSDVRENSERLDQLFAEVDSKPCFKLQFTPESIKSLLTDLAPYMSNPGLIDNDEDPTVQITATAAGTEFSVRTRKASGNIEADCLVVEDRIQLEPIEAHRLCLGSRYIEDFAEALLRYTEKPEDDRLYIVWWPSGDEGSPTKGKVACVAYGASRYLCGRLRS